MTIRVDLKDFAELSLKELYEVMVLRNRVFVVGQKITEEPEVDGLDPQCKHLLMWSDGELLGTARLFWEKSPVMVGRICVDISKQRRGLGTTLMEHLQNYLGNRSAAMHAQAYLEDWYARLGWRRHGEVFEEAGIPHIHMVWDAEENEAKQS